ncbi:sugar phosphate isomerase/epimerase [Falsiroseomonas bella]|uniref:Sugar phosphate isomerase/epimerase n=1 Tax=Falsiroseomonas bella TaxID=2184016 RepID=A0A317FFB5_9PROT|nr:sugar phosphate isomerase/epimerase family protein [Falsiroseomonas bella]PWS37062.1 sugar phosphate isomerase/epimerase [Falsiroseomonas bella]
MRIGIDSYCYHRQFGDWYPGLQQDPGRRMTVWDFLDRAASHGVAGVSLEACYLPLDAASLARIGERLEALGLDAVWAWGHPDGLRSGTDAAAAADLVRHIGIARSVGAKVMRICAGSRRTRPASWAEHRAQLLPMLKPLVAEAERQDVVLAIENHIDLLAEELAEIVTTIGSPHLGVCLDTANNLRMFEDPVKVAGLLAPFTRATHVKNIGARRGQDPKTFAFWPSVPLDAGLVDLDAVLRLLRDAGYGGLLALEIDYLDPDYGTEEEPMIARSLEWLRQRVATVDA